MTDKLERLERHLDEMLAGPRRLMRSLSKTTTGTDAMTDTNDSAHPTIETELYYDNAAGKHYPHVSSAGGLTKREHFAAMAMQGLLSDRRTMTDLGEAFAVVNNQEQGSNLHVAGLRKLISMMSVAHADALIAELNKETP